MRRRDGRKGWVPAWPINRESRRWTDGRTSHLLLYFTRVDMRFKTGPRHAIYSWQNISNIIGERDWRPLRVGSLHTTLGRRTLTGHSGSPSESWLLSAGRSLGGSTHMITMRHLSVRIRYAARRRPLKVYLLCTLRNPTKEKQEPLTARVPFCFSGQI